MLCTIWYHLYNLNSVKNTHGGMLLLLKVTPLHGCFSHFFLMQKWYDIVQSVAYNQPKVKFDEKLVGNDVAIIINPLSGNLTKWSNTLKQCIGKSPTNCLNVFDRFVGLALKVLKMINMYLPRNQ